MPKRKFESRAAECYKPNKPGAGYNVLNHGDFHIKNLLFKHDLEERFEDVYFVCDLTKLFKNNIDGNFYRSIFKLASLHLQQLI